MELVSPIQFRLLPGLMAGHFFALFQFHPVVQLVDQLIQAGFLQ